MNRSSATALLFLATTIIGCGPSTREYSVTIRNQSADPYTVLLTKDTGPIENGWLAPEDMASMLHAPPDWTIHRGILPPGKTADVKQSGQFYDTTNAMLRGYRGELTFEQILGVGPDSPNRTEVKLVPGHNEVIIGPDGKAVRQ